MGEFLGGCVLLELRGKGKEEGIWVSPFWASNLNYWLSRIWLKGRWGMLWLIAHITQGVCFSFRCGFHHSRYTNLAFIGKRRFSI